MDFVSARLADGRWFRMLTVLDLYTRDSLALVADRSLTGVKVAATLNRVLQQRPAPAALTVDNGGEFVSRAMDAWAYAHDVRLDLRDECLNTHVVASTDRSAGRARRLARGLQLRPAAQPTYFSSCGSVGPAASAMGIP